MAAVVVLGVGSASAQDAGWTWNVTPYAWMTGIDGDVGARGMSVPVENDFSDVWDDLDLAGMLTVDGNNGTWGIITDFVYTDLSSEKDTPAGEVGADLEQWLLTAAPYLRLAAKEAVTVDVGAGVRWIDTDLDISGPRGGQSESDNWVDPVVTGRVRWEPAENCSLTLSGDIGGFGVSSEVTWQIAAMAGYQVCEAAEVLVGYRVLSYDYDEDGLLYDVDYEGLALGVAVGF
jgi:hypothetical protein